MARDVIDTLSININASASSAIENISKLQSALRNLNKTVKQTSGLNFSFGGTSASGGAGGASGSTFTRLAGALNAASMATRGFSSAFRATGSVVRSVASKITSQFNLIGKASSALNMAADGAKTLLGSMLGFQGIRSLSGFLQDSIQLGADITEVDHIVEMVFGNMSSAVQNFADSAIENFGLASISAKKYAGFLSAMFQASGLTQEMAGEMGMNLTGLAADLSAFYNISQDEAFEKIRSGMAGMVRPLRSIGIDLTAATLSEYALAQGIQKSYSEMTQAEKVMLRYNYLLDNTRTQQGDFARTAQSMANATRTFVAIVSSVKTSIGEGFVAALRPMMNALNGLMKMLLRAAQAFAVFMQTLTGGKWKSGGAKGISLDLGEADGYADDLADSAGAAADGLGGAAGSAKKLRKELSVLPFDELNQLNKDRDSSGSGGGGGGGGGSGGGLADFGLTEGLFDWRDFLGDDLADAISAWAAKIREAFSERDWIKMGQTIARGFNKGINYLYDALDPNKVKAKLRPFLNAFTVTINSFVDTLNFSKLGATIAAGINDIAFIFGHFLDGINFTNLGTQLARGANGIVDQVDFKKIGQNLGAKFMVVWDILYGFVHKFKWDRLGQQIGDLINNANIRVDFSKIADAIVTGLNGAFTAVFNFAKRVNWGQIANNITNGINTAIRKFNWKQNGAAINKFIQSLLDTAVSIAKGTDWTALGSGIANALQQINWGALLKKVFTVVTEVIGGIWKGLGDTAAGWFIRGIIVYKVGSKLMPFFNSVAQAITGNPSNVNVIGNAFSNLFGKVFKKLGNSYLANALGSFFLDLGGAIKTGLSTFLTSGLAGIAGTIGGIGALVAVGMNEWKKQFDFGAKEMEKRGEEMRDNLAKSAETIEQNFSESTAVVETNAKAAEPYLETLRRLEGQTNLTAEQQAKMQTAITGLNELYPNLGLNIDAVTGSLSMTVTEIENYIEASKNAAMAEAYIEKAKGYYKDAADAMEHLTEVSEDHAKATDELNRLNTRRRKLTDAAAQGEQALAKALKDLGIEGAGVISATDLYNQELSKLDQEIAWTTDQQKGLSEEMQKAQGNYDGLIAKGGQYMETAAGMRDTTDDMTEAIERELEVLNQGNASYDAMRDMIARLGEQNVLTAEQQEYLNARLGEAEGTGKTASEAYSIVQDELRNLGSTSTATMEEVIAAQKAAQEAANNYKQGISDALTKSIDVFNMYGDNAESVYDRIKRGGQVSVDEWIGALDQQIAGMKSWEENVKKLTDWGINQGFLQEIIDAGPEAGEYAQWLVDQGEAEFRKMDSKYREAADVAGMTDRLGQELSSNVDKMFGVVSKEAEAGGKEISDSTKAGLENSLGKIGTLEKASRNLMKNGVLNPQKIEAGISSPSRATEGYGNMLNLGLAKGLNNTGVVETAAKTVMTKLLAPFKNANKDFRELSNSIINALTTGLNAAKGALGTTGSALTTTLLNGMKSGYSAGVINGIVSSIKGAFNFSLWSQGRSVGQSFANGLASVHVKTPHYSIFSYKDLKVGSSRIQIPNFSVNWYERGGLFTGSNGQIIGIAENFKDEAVLPLEDHRAMSRIAEAITGAGGFGADERFAQMVADAVVEAWAQNPQYIDFTNTTTLQVGDEVLARSVEKGQRKLNQRYSPVAQGA